MVGDALVEEAVVGALRVSTLLPLPGAEMVDGAQVAVTPVGSPESLRATLEFKAEFPSVVKAMLPLAPGNKVTEAADSERVRVGATGTGVVTATVTGEELESKPLLATTLKL